MKITDLQIDGFGVWSELKLDQLSDGLTVFCGPNEAGKTTLMQFIRSVLYGFSPERRSRYLPPVHGGRAGGGLGVVDTGGRFTVRRTPSNSLSSDDPGKVEVLSASGFAPRLARAGDDAVRDRRADLQQRLSPSACANCRNWARWTTRKPPPSCTS